ncbi:eukaryotic translation initiation factor 4E transporter-like isoform X7 [Diorhabda sublineata]|uniref:eukaryotic translation initiation factor 4E transporter-like isoform X7 n=1 Tax=Diorhabda sublineata TaxID=1163346 RepID=UPI0024E104F9|nr:eukaryotic translation initiation factor 4E transporter-like isoform X7 [Diorhabda sublineata]XP_056637853.1 eukaryotic translation initiation factor 4E transporter-like isoform X7 [Diorhabda sublineata]
MSMSQASETEKMQMKILSDKQSKNGDEQVEGMSVSDVPTEDFADPAILVIRENVKISYSKDELLKLREAPLSKKKPDFIDPSEVCPSIWDTEKWGIERKKSDTPIENGPRSSGDGPSEHRRRPGDPRERIRKENDGIVLSPQRRSFNSGCFVPVRGDATRNNRSHSPLGSKNEPSHMGMREIQSNTRRIGSGRILRDPWDFNDKLDSGDNEYSYRSQQRNNNNDRDDKFGDKYERRSFGRDFDITRDRENNNKDARRISKGFERRRISDREQEEPEWFSGGPLSQNDTIELRGFDDEKPTRKKLSPPNLKRAKEVKKKSEPVPVTSNGEEKKEQDTRTISEQNVTSAPPVGGQNDKKEKPDKPAKDELKDNKVDTEKTETEGVVNALADEHSFNFDEILKCETIPGLLTNGIGTDGDNTKSRFSRWFKQESPEKLESRRSSLHEDHHIIKHLLKDIGETSVTIPGDSDAYFAPISPAGNTGVKKEIQPQSQPINIMEILQRGKQQAEPTKQSITGKILSLDELEAKIRQNVEASTGISTKHHQKPDEDMAAAFKKLLEQAQSGGHPASNSASMNKTQPMSLLEMLNHSQQQDEAARLSATTPHLLGASNINMGNIQHHVSNDLTMKLQQAQFQQQQQQKQQMDMLNKLINATTSVHPQQLRASPLHDLVMQQSRDLLNRPEAQAILQAMHQRIPSPRELQVHTQNILQRALIKKKLEEQQENYRKKQEMQRGQSPSNNASQTPSKNVPSPTPLAFTPTSVLRKMTAEKEEGKETKANTESKVPPGRPLTGMRTQPPQQQWNPSAQFMSVKHPGIDSRPIVKANNNFQSPMTDQFFGQQAPPPQQQQVMQQQRAQQQQLAYQQQQQRKVLNPQVLGSQYPTNQGVPQSQYNPQQYSSNQQFTQQQLRAQHQHRPANQQQSVQQQQHQQMNFQQQNSQQQNMSGGNWQQFFNSSHPANRNSKASTENDGIRATSTSSSTATVNQLARWFSPDLLERARVGELPSTAGLSQHVLSLEEIERQTAPPVHN